VSDVVVAVARVEVDVATVAELAFAAKARTRAEETKSLFMMRDSRMGVDEEGRGEERPGWDWKAKASEGEREGARLENGFTT
jgi:hypothetical protein